MPIVIGMQSALQKRILDGVLLMLRPMAKLMLRCGVSYTEFADLAKVAFVNVAAEEFGIRGRQTNASRIAVMTGLSRKEVKRIKELGEDLPNSDFVRETPGSVVLQHWHTNPDFTDEQGNPRVLPFKGGEHSFSALVAMCAGDIPPGAMRAEWLRVGAIEKLEGEMLRTVKTHYFPDNVEDRTLLALREILPPAIETAAFNCNPNLKVQLETFCQGVASVDGVPAAVIPDLRPVLREKLDALGEDVVSYLAPYENKGDVQDKSNQVGVGFYYYELGTDK